MTKARVRINGELRGTPSVNLIGADGALLGKMTLAAALRMAMKAGLDLVEVNPTSNPPTCKLLDFSKYKFDALKQAAIERRNAQAPEPPPNITWIPFECDGRELEYVVFPSKSKDRPRGWPAHKPSPGKWYPVQFMMVRSRGDEKSGGFGYVFRTDVLVTLEDAMGVAREFRQHIP